MVIILGMTLDLGYIHVSQSELRRTSDAAALAGCWELFDGKVHHRSTQEITALVNQTADQFSAENVVARTAPHLSSNSEDVTLGYFDVATSQFDANSSNDFNAVRVIVRRQDGSNGEVPLLFGAVSGRYTQPMTATSTAALINAVSGFYVPEEDDKTIDLLPFALDEQTWNQVQSGLTGDSMSWENGVVINASNGQHECNLYPQGTGSPGNRGTVDIGPSNNSTRDISRQIVYGVSRQDLDNLNSPLELNAQGELFLNGDTGISAGVKDDLQSIIGEKRVIPIFRSVHGNGNNATYTIVKFAGVRILEVQLTGRMSQKRLIVEPAPIVARYAKIRTDGQSTSDYVYTPVLLVN